MGYYVDITCCDIIIKNEEEVARIIEKHGYEDVFKIDEDSIVPVEYYMKLPNNIYLFLAELARVAAGEIAFRGEDGAMWKVELADGKVIEYTATVVYDKAGEGEAIQVPEEVVNERYVGVFRNNCFILYDLKEKKWCKVNFYGSISDVENARIVLQGEKLPEEHYTDFLPSHEVEAVKNVVSKLPPELAKRFAVELL